MSIEEALKVLLALEQMRKESTSPRMDMDFALKLEPIILEIATAIRDRVKSEEKP